MPRPAHHRPGALLPGLLAALLAAACGGTQREPRTVTTCHQWATGWDLMPHRLSHLELTAAPTAGGARVSARIDGGSFGGVDSPWARYGLTRIRSRDLAAVYGSIEVAIAPGDEVAGEPFSTRAELVLPAAELAGSRRLAAFFHGLRLRSDGYDGPPPFGEDYDPALGYTSGGLGLALDAPLRDGDTIRVGLRVRNTLAPADRADMNAAIEQATTWLRVDVAVVGAYSRHRPALASGSTDYFISAADYGQNSVHPHAAAAAQMVPLAGLDPDTRAVIGIQAFDLWLNQPGHHHPDCTVIQDELNFEGQPVSGPGRYLRELSAACGPLAPSGDGAGAALDLYLSNSSTFTEVGNLCLGAAGRLAALPFADPAAEIERLEPVELALEVGQPGQRELHFQH